MSEGGPPGLPALTAKLSVDRSESVARSGLPCCLLPAVHAGVHTVEEMSPKSPSTDGS